MVYHAPEWRNAGSCADQINIFFQRLVHDEHTLRSTKTKFRANDHIIPDPWSARAEIIQHDHQFQHIAAVGPGCDGITAPALIGLFMNGKVEGDKLAGSKIKGAELRDLYPESFCISSFVLDPGDFTDAPWLQCHIALFGEDTIKYNK